jgi:hypothetical protein
LDHQKREAEMTNYWYAILDTNAGLLQWIGEASESGEAYDKAAADLNVDDYDLIGGSECFELSLEEAREVQEWWDNGAASIDCPECIRSRR